MEASFHSYDLQFKTPAGTSRGILHSKTTYLLRVKCFEKEYMGECALFKGLSADSELEYEDKLQWVCEHINEDKEFLIDSCKEFPSIQFGLEQVFLQIKNRKSELFFESDFIHGNMGIQINGLIWMGDLDFMREQIQNKIEQKYNCIKLKIGVNWEGEYSILKSLRKEFPANKLEIRVDANGGFTFDEAPKILEQLAGLQIHSIEQPIKAGQIELMADLCKISPTPIALDEELIGKFSLTDKEILLKKVKPQYIILKPALVGGFKGSKEWIDLAKNYKIGWWITSALESNLGLNAIAQWTATLNNSLPQGLGTGGLYTNNFPSNLEVRGDRLYYNL